MEEGSKKKDSIRCEGIIHKRRIVTDPFTLETSGKIPLEVYTKAAAATGVLLV